MPGGNHTTKAQVLLRAAALLKAKYPDFAERVHIVIEDEVPDTLQAPDLITLQILGGQFDVNAIAGNVVPYQGNLRVIVWVQNHSDQPGTAQSLLTLPGRGLLRVETKILKAFLGSYLHEVEAGGDGYTPLLTDTMKPVSDSQGQGVKNTGVPGYKATCSIEFLVPFMWDLDGDVDSEPENLAT